MYYIKYNKETLVVTTIIECNDDTKINFKNLNMYEVSDVFPENKLKNIPGLRIVLIYKDKKLMWVYR